MTRYGWLAIAAGGSFVALSLAVWQRIPAVVAVDTMLHTWAITERNEATIAVARAVTEAGSTYVAIPAVFVLGLLALSGRPAVERIGGAVLLTAVASLGASLGLAVNAAINGVRPGETDWAGAAGGPTFPSGHTTVATLLAASVAWAASVRLGDAWPRRSVWIAAAVIAGAVGVSRVWLGVHWPSDVLGGWLYGSAWAAIAIIAVQQIRLRRSRLSNASVSR